MIVCSAAIPFFTMYMYFKPQTCKTVHVMVPDSSGQPNLLRTKHKLLFITLLFALMFCYCSVEDTTSGFLVTFCIRHLKWDTEISSYATSTFWTTFSVGRFSGIFLVRYFKPVKLLTLHLVLLITSFVGLLFASLAFSQELVWCFIALAGFSMSVIFPCIFSWTQENIIAVSGVISAMFLIAASSGSILNPLFLAYLMDNFSPMWFMYLLLCQSCLCFMIFLTIFILTKLFITVSRIPKSQYIDIIIAEHVTQDIDIIIPEHVTQVTHM